MPSSGLLRVHRQLHVFGQADGIVVEHELHRLQHRGGARRARVEIVAQRLFEQAVVDPLRLLLTPVRSAEELQALRRVAAPAQADDGGHARVVPAVDVLLLDELDQLALAHHHVGEVEPVELVLVRQQERVGLALVERGLQQRREALGVLEQQLEEFVGVLRGEVGVLAPAREHRFGAALVAAGAELVGPFRGHVAAVERELALRFDAGVVDLFEHRRARPRTAAARSSGTMRSSTQS